MNFLEPVVRIVGRLSFRNKLKATAVVFGIPLLVVATALYQGLDERVSALRAEKSALAVQLPILTLIGELNQLAGALMAKDAGIADSVAVATSAQDRALAGLEKFRLVAVGNSVVRAVGGPLPKEIGDWSDVKSAINDGRGDEILAAAQSLRAHLDRINEKGGLLADSNTATSRLLDVVSSHLPGLVDTAGNATRLGTLVLIKKSVRGSVRTDLTLQRGNFDALVQWCMDALQKVGADHPDQAERLNDAGARMNTAYLPVQEAITIKMLDTTDYDMSPTVYLGLTAKAFEEILSIANEVVTAGDSMVGERLFALEVQRNVVILAMMVTFVIVAGGFVAAYISIMRGLNGLSEAVSTMAGGDLSVRVSVSSEDEIGTVSSQFNAMAERLAEQTEQVREKTNHIHGMLENLEQGILAIVSDGSIHPEYSAFLESIFETEDIGGKEAMAFLFDGSRVGTDSRSQMETAVAACIGEDRMNFDFNVHLLLDEMHYVMPDGREKILDLDWSPICDENDVVEKVMVSVRDVTELRRLQAEAEHQKRELAMIGQILKVSQEKFHEFVDSARHFVGENARLLASKSSDAALINELFRNMHTIKGNARTYGLLHLTNIVHEAEQSYDAIRRGEAVFDACPLAQELERVTAIVEEYAHLNEETLGRKGPGRRGGAEKYLMVDRQTFDTLQSTLKAYDLNACERDTLAAILRDVRSTLAQVGTVRLGELVSPVVSSLPSLAAELHKAVPEVVTEDAGVRLQNQVSDTLRNVFMHLYRNAMDHGIETPEERQAKGKPAAGRITLTAGVSGDALSLALSDDGKGLALGYIRKKALERGLIGSLEEADDARTAQLIFAAGFSTATAVTEVSGRGVGMDAVKAFIAREGGSIALEFTDDCTGADFRAFRTVITLPARLAVLPEDAPEAVRRNTAKEASQRTAPAVLGGLGLSTV